MIPYAELEVAGDATLDADLRGMFGVEPGSCWFRPLTIPARELRRSAVSPEAYLLSEGGAGHYREAREMREAYRAGAHLPPVIVYLPELRAGRDTPEVLDGYHRLSAAFAADVEELEVLLLVDENDRPLRPLEGGGPRAPGPADQRSGGG